MKPWNFYPISTAEKLSKLFSSAYGVEISWFHSLIINVPMVYQIYTTMCNKQWLGYYSNYFTLIKKHIFLSVPSSFGVSTFLFSSVQVSLYINRGKNEKKQKIQTEKWNCVLEEQIFANKGIAWITVIQLLIDFIKASC